MEMCGDYIGVYKEREGGNPGIPGGRGGEGPIAKCTSRYHDIPKPSTLYMSHSLNSLKGAI